MRVCVCACVFTCVGAICMKSMCAHFPQLFSTTAHNPSQSVNDSGHMRSFTRDLTSSSGGFPSHGPSVSITPLGSPNFPLILTFSFIGTSEVFQLRLPGPWRMMVVYEPSSKAQELAGTFPQGSRSFPF